MNKRTHFRPPTPPITISMIKTSISIKPGKLIFCISAINSFQRLLQLQKLQKLQKSCKNLQKLHISRCSINPLTLRAKLESFIIDVQCVVCKPKWSCNQARTKWVEMWRNYVVVRRRFAGILGTLGILGFLDSCTVNKKYRNNRISSIY